MSRSLTYGWNVELLVDDDGHLNVYIENDHDSTINEVWTGQGDGQQGEQMALRFTTPTIEMQTGDCQP